MMSELVLSCQDGLQDLAVLSRGDPDMSADQWHAPRNVSFFCSAEVEENMGLSYFHVLNRATQGHLYQAGKFSAFLFCCEAGGKHGGRQMR